MNHAKLKFVTLIILGVLILSALCWLFLIKKSQQDPCRAPSSCVNQCPKPCKPQAKPCSHPRVDGLPAEMHQGIFLHGEILSNNMIMVNYQTPVGNSPEAHKSWIGLWEGNTIQQGQTPLKSKTITGNENTGTLFLDNLKIEAVDYVVGYGIGTDIVKCSVASTLSFGGDLPLMTQGVSNASSMEVLESGDNYMLFQLLQPVNDCSLTGGHTIAIKYENTYQVAPNQNTSDQLDIPDSTQNYYASLKAPSSFDFISPQNIVQIDNDLFIITDYPMRQLEWYTMAHLNMIEGDTSIVSTCTFKVNSKQQTAIN